MDQVQLRRPCWVSNKQQAVESFNAIEIPMLHATYSDMPHHGRHVTYLPDDGTGADPRAGMPTTTLSGLVSLPSFTERRNSEEA